MIYIGVFPTMFFDPSMLTFVGMDSCHEQPSKILTKISRRAAEICNRQGAGMSGTKRHSL
jgi:hypothetical protein